ncbi:MAG: ACP S-malonyltransferase [Candidatus Omnitrophota bacterium]
MVDSALIFPGQGAQYVGMGRDLYEQYPAAKVIYEKANKILGFDIAKICFEGPKEELTRTDICQPAILITSIAALRSLESILSSPILPYAALGLSLGEYTALVYAGSFTFEDGVHLVRKRGEFMEEASRENPGTMASIIGLPLKETEKVCKEAGAQIANLNCPGQIVISGVKKKVEAALSLARERGAKRAIPLEVSGAFHSDLMEPAANKLKLEIDKINICAPKIKVISNVTARYEISSKEIKDNLVAQVKSPVLWEDSIRFLVGEGIKKFIEIGPGKVLAGLLRRIDSTLECFNVETAADVKNFLL